MKTIKLEGTPRTDFGKKATSLLRRQGLVPCIIYGEGETVHFTLNARDLKGVIYTPQSFIVEFNIDGKKEIGVMREAQYHPVKEEILHIDFFRITPGKPVSIEIPVKLVGVSEGVKLGGKLSLAKRKIRVLALAENLPDTLDVDVTKLDLGKSIFVGDLKFDNMTIQTPASTAICAVKMTRAARGAADTEAPAGK